MTPHLPTRKDAFRPLSRHTQCTVKEHRRRALSADDSSPEALYSTCQMKPPHTIPKTLQAKVARVASLLRKPPRLVLKEAIDEYVARHDPGVAGAAGRILERAEW